MSRIHSRYETEYDFDSYSVNEDKMELEAYMDTPYDVVEPKETIPSDAEIDALLYASQDPKLVKEYKKAIARGERLWQEVEIDEDVSFLWTLMS